MPYIALELDAMNVAPDVGRAAGLPEDSIIAGMVRMWAYCWRSKTDHVSPGKVRGFFGGDAAEALRDFGFLEADGVDYRVKGADRYLRIENARSENGKRAAANGNLRRGKVSDSAQQVSSTPPAPLQHPSSTPPAGLQHPSSSAPALSSSTEHRIEESKDFAGSAQSASPPPVAGQSSLADRRKKPRPPPDPRHAPLKARMEGTYRTCLGETWQFDGSDAKALSQLIGKDTDEEIETRWQRGLNAEFFRVRRVRELLSKWGHHAEMGPAPPRHDAAVESYLNAGRSTFDWAAYREKRERDSS